MCGAQCSLFWVKYVNPWIRCLVLLLSSLYVFLVSGNLTTFRANHFIRTHECQLVLWDLTHDVSQELGIEIPQTNGGSKVQENLLLFVDIVVTLAVVIMVIAVLLYCHKTRGLALVAQVVWLESFVMLLNAACQIFTTIPDVDFSKDTCVDPKYSELGTWVFTRVSANFCGDMLFSGHAWHFTLAAIVTRRVLQSQYFRGVSGGAWLILYDLIVVVLAVLFVLALIRVRSHYSVDIILAVALGLLALTNDRLLNFGVRLLYRPYTPVSEHEERIAADAEPSGHRSPCRQCAEKRLERSQRRESAAKSQPTTATAATTTTTPAQRKPEEVQ